MNNTDTIEVFINEDYGYNYWVWKPKMTEKQFVDWWTNLTEVDIIKYFFNIRSLGNIEKMDLNSIPNNEKNIMDNVPYYCHMNDVDDSFIQVGNTRYPFRRTTRRDWKENWIDWTLKHEKSLA
jgi:hypothetical protein